jgi:hypothetical protein
MLIVRTRQPNGIMRNVLKKLVPDHLPNLAVLGLLLVAGCASQNPGRMMLDPVGPAPGGSEVGRSGMLVVYSTYNQRTNVDRFFGQLTYSDYSIYTKNGTLLQQVRNDAGEAAGPVMVKLPAAAYQVVAFATGYGVLTVPVVIKANRVTVVHLDEGTWPDRGAMIQAGAVRLPDGRIVGWRAAPRNVTNP